LLAAVAIALCACGPVAATSTISDAEVAVLRAHATEGEKYAAYETTLADLYLQKAREEQGHARYADARDLAIEARRIAELAARKAGDRRGGTPETAPAQRAVIQRGSDLPPPPMVPPEKPAQQPPPPPTPKP
jgi:hypothetical protein